MSTDDSQMGDGGQEAITLTQIVELLAAQNQRLAAIESRQTADREAY